MLSSSIFAIEPFSWIEIGAAVFCGFIIGSERQFRGKPAGIRTSALIILGTYIFVAASLFVATDSTDPSRIIGQVVTGIGFLGAGVTIWGLAAIGVCIAAVSVSTAIKLSIVIVLVLVGVDLFERYFSAFTRGVHKRMSRNTEKQG